MDGLLFDSERIVQRSWEIAGNELGIQHMGEVIYHTLGMNRTGRNEYFRKYIREDFPFEEFGELTRDNFWKIVDKEGLPLKSGAKELLAYGKAQGYKMAVATSSSREYAMRNLIRTGIDAYFDSVICGDMVKTLSPMAQILRKQSRIRRYIRKQVKVWEYSRKTVWLLKTLRVESCQHIRPECV